MKEENLKKDFSAEKCGKCYRRDREKSNNQEIEDLYIRQPLLQLFMHCKIEGNRNVGTGKIWPMNVGELFE